MATRSSTPTLLDTLTGVPRLSSQTWRRTGWLRRYLIATRAAVLPLTVCACLFGGLLALPLTPGEGWRLILATVALVLAHAASNLLNDQVDWVLGLDRNSHSRVRYGVNPLAQGFMHPLNHAALLVTTGICALLPALMVGSAAGPPVYWLAGAGVLLLAFYAWPLKRLGLGELCVWLVWGPMLVGGVYWLVSGDWGPEIAVLSAIFGLGPAVMVLGQHADQRRDDAARNIRTLPVILGPTWGPGMMAAVAVAQMTAGLGWAFGTSSWAYLLLLAALPALASLVWISLRARPTARPKHYPAHRWPLWYTVAAFRFARTAGVALAGAALLDGL